MQKLKYVNPRGEEIELSSYFPYLVSNITGLGGAAATNACERGFMQDGQNYYSTLLEPRLISFDIYIQGGSARDLAAKRNDMMRVFNPKEGAGTLYIYEIAEGEEVLSRQIECVVDGEIIYGEKLNSTTQKFSVSLLASNPVFMSTIVYENKLVGFVGGLELPMDLPFILAKQGDSCEIEYDGDISGSLLIEFRGEASMPKIVKEETREIIEIEIEIGEGESLFIDTEPFGVDVYKIVNGNRVNANNYVKPTSDYFQLTRGNNTISFSAASGNPEVYISYRERFLGF